MPHDTWKVTVRRQRPTELMKAVQAQDVDEVTSCIRAGDDLEARDSYGQTALHWAAKYESLEIVRRLLEAGANSSVEDEDGETPLLTAQMKGRHAIAELLSRHAGDLSHAEKKRWQFWK